MTAPCRIANPDRRAAPPASVLSHRARRRAHRRIRKAAPWYALVASAAWPAATALAEPSTAAETQAALDAQPATALPPLQRLAPGHPDTDAAWRVDPAHAPHLGRAVEHWVRQAADPGATSTADLQAELDRLCRGAQPLACTLLQAVEAPALEQGWRRIDTELVDGLCAAGDDEACVVGWWLAARGAAAGRPPEACPSPAAPRAAAARCGPDSEARPRRKAGQATPGVGILRREKRK